MEGNVGTEGAVGVDEQIFAAGVHRKLLHKLNGANLNRRDDVWSTDVDTGRTIHGLGTLQLRRANLVACDSPLRSQQRELSKLARQLLAHVLAKSRHENGRVDLQFNNRSEEHTSELQSRQYLV